MRQVHKFLRLISHAESQASLVQFYMNALSYKTDVQKLPSLDKFLDLSFKKENETQFDADTDKKLEEQALKRLMERRAQHG